MVLAAPARGWLCGKACLSPESHPKEASRPKAVPIQQVLPQLFSYRKEHMSRFAGRRCPGGRRERGRGPRAAEEGGCSGCAGRGRAPTAGVARVHVEDRVKWRLNIRKHFPALARIWLPGRAVGCLRRDRLQLSRELAGGGPPCGLHPPHHHILFFFLHSKASCSSWQRGCGGPAPT